MWVLGQALLAILFFGGGVIIEYLLYRRAGKVVWAARKYDRVLEFNKNYLKPTIFFIFGLVGVWCWFKVDLPGIGVGYALWIITECILLFVGYRFVTGR